MMTIDYLFMISLIYRQFEKLVPSIIFEVMAVYTVIYYIYIYIIYIYIYIIYIIIYIYIYINLNASA